MCDDAYLQSQLNLLYLSQVAKVLIWSPAFSTSASKVYTSEILTSNCTILNILQINSILCMYFCIICSTFHSNDNISWYESQKKQCVVLYLYYRMARDPIFYTIEGSYLTKHKQSSKEFSIRINSVYVLTEIYYLRSKWLGPNNWHNKRKKVWLDTA